MGSRAENSDSAKHGMHRTKAMASTPAQWPRPMGEWDAPGQTIVTDTDEWTTADDTMEHDVPGPVQYNPISKPIP